MELKRIEITEEDMQNKNTIIHHKDTQLRFNCENGTFYGDVTNEEVVKYLKGIYRSKGRYMERFINRLRLPMEEILSGDGSWKDYSGTKYGQELYDRFNNASSVIDKLEDMFDEVEPFSYVEAFNIKDNDFQAKVFGSINITEMIKELGHKRIATAGHPVECKQFDYEGNYTGLKKYDNIYEVHEVDGSKLKLTEKLYVLKCWCTSTNKEHWLWIEDEYKDDPLKAVASTFRIHENLIPHITELKRQGDILLVEMDKDVEPEGDEVPLTPEQYFTLLKGES